MRLFVARHGQTTWNAQDRVLGRTDLPLTEEGLRQAFVLAQKTAELQLDMIITSPMLRARQTAAAVGETTGLPVQVDQRLIEQDYGIFEGVSRFDEGFLANKRQFAVRYPGGESMMDVAYRTYSLIEELKQKYPDKNILLVCHGGVCRLIRTYFEDMTNDEYFHYCELNANIREYQA
ncbi:MAG: histidine phosphatase family protein [Oscillospiraceae bacterium]|nr:histidine phosphatase family protein [Oscillospiraceae bacterium]